MTEKRVNRIYQIYDLRDSIKSAIDNLEELVKNQELLAKAIKESPVKDSTLDEFVKGLESNIKEYKEKLDKLSLRYIKAKTLTDIHEAKSIDTEASDDAVTLAIEAMGLDQPEPEGLPN